MLSFKNVNIIFILLLIVFVLLKTSMGISFWWLFRLTIIWLTLTSIGSFHIRWNYFLKAKHNKHNSNEKVLCLTFDDGPDPEFTPKTLKLLKEYNAKATFFCIGMNAEKYPEIVNQIIAEGHVIGNHSYIHSNNYGFLSTKKIIADIKKAQKTMRKITNLNLQFFRPPFGVTNPNIAKAIKEMKMKTFGWSIRTYDTTSKKSEKIISQMCSKIVNGDIILLHDTSEKSIYILEQLLQFLMKNNLKSVTLEELFNSKAYE